MSGESKEPFTSSDKASSQTFYRKLRVIMLEKMITDMIRIRCLPKKELERIPMPWFKWLQKSIERREIEVPKEIKKRVGKPRKNELRYYDDK